MEKIHPLLEGRYSPVIFSSKEIEEETLISLFEAARWAPSAFNEQPWRFIVGLKKQNENYNKLFDCLVDANKYWAQYAPVLVLSISKKTSSTTGKPNRFAQHDLGLAVGNLLLQATSLNLFVHQMGGYNVEKAIKNFDLSSDFEPMSLMAIGYKGKPELFPEDLRERESKKRLRRPLDDMLL